MTIEVEPFSWTVRLIDKDDAICAVVTALRIDAQTVMLRGGVGPFGYRGVKQVRDKLKEMGFTHVLAERRGDTRVIRIR